MKIIQFGKIIKYKYIYFLRDPKTLVVKYVGISSNPQKRLIRHFMNAREGQKYPVYFWLRELLQDNLKPIVNIIQKVEEVDWNSTEQFWISAFGNQLFNITAGGAGTVGFSHTKEETDKIFNSSSNISEETRKKMSESRKGNTNSKGNTLSVRTRRAMAISRNYRRKYPLAWIRSLDWKGKIDG